MEKTIFLLQKDSDYKIFDKHFKNNPDSKIIALDYESHKILEKKQIVHILSDNFLNINDFDKIDSLTIDFIENWKPKSKNFRFNEIELLDLISHELYSYVLTIVFNATIIKKILEIEKPKRIFDFSEFGELINEYSNDKIQYFSFSKTNSTKLYHDQIKINFSFMRLDFDLKLSRNRFHKIKALTSNFLINLSKSKIKNSNSVHNTFFVNFDPIQYEELLKESKESNQNVILYNTRKPAIWNKKSFDIIKKYNLQIFNYDEIEKENLEEIKIHQNRILNDLKEYFDQNKSFLEINTIFDNIPLSKFLISHLKKIYFARLKESITRIFILKKFFETYNISTIIQWAEVGQEEKECVLTAQMFDIPTFMLQHGRFLTAKKWTKISNITGHMASNPLSKNFLVWGNFTKQFGIEQGYNSKNIFVVGSPRHDKFFNQIPKKSTKSKIILATTGAHYLSADTSTITNQLKHDKFIKEIYEIFKKKTDKELIIRPHPSPILTEHIHRIFDKLDPKIRIDSSPNLLELISDAELVIAFNNSTICLDAIAMGKPVISLQTDDWALEEEIVKNNGVFSIDNVDDCENTITQIMSDKNFQERIISNSKQFLENYMVNIGSSSKSLSDLISNLENYSSENQ